MWQSPELPAFQGTRRRRRRLGCGWCDQHTGCLRALQKKLCSNPFPQDARASPWTASTALLLPSALLAGSPPWKSAQPQLGLLSKAARMCAARRMAAPLVAPRKAEPGEGRGSPGHSCCKESRASLCSNTAGATDKSPARTGVAKVLEEFQGCFQVLLDLKDDPWQTPPDASQHF